MEPSVRPGRPTDDGAADLLYESAAPYYDAYAGGSRRARRVLSAVYPRRGHTASYEICRVAELDGEIVGVMAAFPSAAGDRLARRFLGLTVARMPAWHWPVVLRHLKASAKITPVAPPRTLYVDALAVRADARRRGVASALLREAEEMARDVGATAISLDTGLENTGAQALYEALGFTRTQTRETPDPRVARAVGGRGFVSYIRPL
jgi:ribosomal protein S18 acetylase RimI-like enzyme